ncbi:MAG: hypothetical protein KF718_31325 [Polyangiaceae bacterium]|nr:hypothetical protein [Polyangiaceae bacterium]
MTIDDTLDTLLSEATPALRKAVQQAYELGYRAALASAPVALAQPTPTASADDVESADEDDFEPTDAPPSVIPPTDASQTDEELEDRSDVDWSALDEAGVAPSAASAPRPPRPIAPHATVGTLRRRIIKRYGLERFDIDVVICRAGDRTRRQLKQSVKLSKYLVEG